VPAPSDLELTGLTLREEQLDTLLGVDVEGWLAEIPLIREYYAQFGMRLPAELSQQLEQLERRLRRVQG
jgi:phosphoenolpyruvate carboxykinase (GTP)